MIWTGHFGWVLGDEVGGFVGVRCSGWFFGLERHAVKEWESEDLGAASTLGSQSWEQRLLYLDFHLVTVQQRAIRAGNEVSFVRSSKLTAPLSRKPPRRSMVALRFRPHAAILVLHHFCNHGSRGLVTAYLACHRGSQKLIRCRCQIPFRHQTDINDLTQERCRLETPHPARIS